MNFRFIGNFEYFGNDTVRLDNAYFALQCWHRYFWSTLFYFYVKWRNGVSLFLPSYTLYSVASVIRISTVLQFCIFYIRFIRNRILYFNGDKKWLSIIYNILFLFISEVLFYAFIILQRIKQKSQKTTKNNKKIMGRLLLVRR